MLEINCLQVRSLAEKVGSRATPEGIAEALDLVARVEREAALDAGGSGWGTDLTKFLTEVTLSKLWQNKTGLEPHAAAQRLASGPDLFAVSWRDLLH